MLSSIYRRHIWALFSTLLIVQESSSLKSMVIRVPEVVKSGDTVTLTCEYDLEQVPLYSIKWYWNDEEFYRYIPKESPPFKAFPVTFVNVDLSKSGENVVTLRGVHRQLTGDYKCEVSADGPLFHTDILVAHMIVADLPSDDPVMNLRDTKVELGKKIEVDCFSSGSDPAANISWFINNEQVKENSAYIKIYPTQIDFDSTLDLKSSRSKIEIVTNKSQFIQGPMSLRCDVSIYSVWNRSIENFVRDDSPKLAQVLGSTLSQSQMDPTFELGNRARWTSSISNINFFICLFLSFTVTIVR